MTVVVNLWDKDSKDLDFKNWSKKYRDGGNEWKKKEENMGWLGNK